MQLPSYCLEDRYLAFASNINVWSNCINAYINFSDKTSFLGLLTAQSAFIKQKLKGNTSIAMRYLLLNTVVKVINLR
jgi:hypothetical protein